MFSLPWSSKAIRRVKDVIQWLNTCPAYLKPCVHYQYLKEKKKNCGGNQKRSHAKWVSRVNFMLSYAPSVGSVGWAGNALYLPVSWDCRAGRECPVSTCKLRLGSVLLSLPCGFDVVTFVFVPVVPEYILVAREWTLSAMWSSGLAWPCHVAECLIYRCAQWPRAWKVLVLTHDAGCCK